MAFPRDEKRRGETEDDKLELPSDMEAIRAAVESPTNMRMSHVREPEGSDSPVWKSDVFDNMEPASKKVDRTMQDRMEPGTAPLFVKVERYHSIISTITYIKETMKVIHNSFTVLQELNNVRQQTLNVIGGVVEKIDQKLAELDNTLVRPTGIKGEEVQPQEDKVERRGMQSDMDQLREQIRSLKTEVQQL